MSVEVSIYSHAKDSYIHVGMILTVSIGSNTVIQSPLRRDDVISR